MTDQTRRCANCKFHDTVISSDKTITTICRVNAPQVLSMFVKGQNGLDVVQSNIWPNMKPDDWCGRFEVQLH